MAASDAEIEIRAVANWYGGHLKAREEHLDRLRPELLVSPLALAARRALAGLMAQGRRFSGAVVQLEVAKHLGGRELSEADKLQLGVVLRDVCEATWQDTLREVEQRTHRRQLKRAAQDVLALASNPDTDFAELLALELPMAAAFAPPVEETVATTMAAARAKLVADIYRGQKEGVVPGIDWGFWPLQKLCGSLYPGDLVYVGARPGVGKTALSQQVLNGISRQHCGLMVSLEMGTADLARRENQLETGVSARVQRDFTRMNDAQFKAIIDATEVGKWHGSAVYLRRQPAATPSQIGHVIKAVKRQAAKDWTGSNRRELKAVVVDHVHLMRPDERRLQGESAWASISGRLKELAIEHGVAMICPAQLNRETEAGGKHREPRVSDIRGSGAFEQDADTIVLIDREEGQNEGTIIIGKGRYSGASRIDVAWESRRTKYTSIDGDEPPQAEQRTLENDGVPF